MDADLPVAWVALSAYQRDVMLAVAHLDGASGRALHDAVGGVDGRKHYSQTIRQVQALRDRDLVTGDPPEGRNTRWVLTDDGRALLADVREWVGCD